MLTIVDAWSNESFDGHGFAIWFAATSPSGRWWLIAWVSNAFGFQGMEIQEITGHEAVIREMEADAAEYGDWAPVDPAAALGRVRDEFTRAEMYPWTRVYSDHFQVIRDEHERFWAAMEGSSDPEPYDRAQFLAGRQ